MCVCVCVVFFTKTLNYTKLVLIIVNKSHNIRLRHTDGVSEVHFVCTDVCLFVDFMIPRIPLNGC